ncbi:MAG: hypothetical protein WDZ94_01155 [Patescibacteria group bacterium]
MYETIDESISVAGVYRQGKFIPKKFLWQQRAFVITQVTFVADIRDGSDTVRQYTVVASEASYRLLFNRTHETWRLKEVWCE